MKVILVMPSLLLQKPKTSKSKDHNAALKRRMDLCENGNIQAVRLGVLSVLETHLGIFSRRKKA